MTATSRTARKTARKTVASLVAAAAAAAAIATAPAASASTVTCRDGGGARVCQKPGHSALHAKPTTRAHSGALLGRAWLPGYGYGHLPPMIALD